MASRSGEIFDPQRGGKKRTRGEWKEEKEKGRVEDNAELRGLFWGLQCEAIGATK